MQRAVVRAVCSGLRSQPVYFARSSIGVGASRTLSGQATASQTTAAPGTEPAQVCVLGGGFGGLYAAVRLESLLWPNGKKPHITLVDQHERFVFKPLLYELLNDTAEPEEVAPYFNQVLAPYNINFVQAKVQRVRPENTTNGSSITGGQVLLSDGSTLTYDYLVVALGAEVDTRGIPGVKQHAVPFNNYDNAIKIKMYLDLMESRPLGSTVVVVGGGYAGAELSAVVGEKLKGKGCQVKLVTGGSDVLEGAPEGQRDATRQALQQAGVGLITGARVKALRDVPPPPRTSPSSDLHGDNGGSAAGIPYGHGDNMLPPPCVLELEGVADLPQLQADLVLWTAGQAPASRHGLDTTLDFPFPTGPRGALLTQPTLQVVNHKAVFAIGDISGSPTATSGASGGADGSFPTTAQVAFQQADYVAWNVWASINNRTLLPFRYQHLGSMMALGSTNAAVALPLALPSALAEGIKASPLAPVFNAVGVVLGAPEKGESEVTLQGPLAAVLRRAAYLYRQPTTEQRLAVAASWLQRAVGAAAALTQGLPGAPGQSSSSR